MLLTFALGAQNIADVYPSEQEPELLSYSVIWNDKQHDISYRITGADVNNILVSFQKLRFELSSSNSDGELFFAIPRSLITSIHHESWYEGFYEGFFAESDSDMLSVGVIDVTCDAFVMSVKFPKGTTAINIHHPHLPGYSNQPLPPDGYIIYEIITVGNEDFFIPLRTNSYGCDLHLLQNEKRIHVNIDSVSKRWDGEKGYFEISLPERLLRGNFTILVDGEEIAFQQEPDIINNSTTIKFQYDDDAKSIDIIGTEIIPEFRTPIALMLAIATGSALSLFQISNNIKRFW